MRRCPDHPELTLTAIPLKRFRPTHGQIDALINQLDELTNFLDRLTLLRPEESHRAILTWSRTGKIPGSESDVVVGVGHQSSQGISSNGNDNLAGTRIVNETGINSTAGRLDDRASDYSRYPIAGAQDRDHTRFNRSRSPTGRTYRDKDRDRDRVSDGQAASVRFGSSEGQSGIEHVGTVSLDERTSFTRQVFPLQASSKERERAEVKQTKLTSDPAIRPRIVYLTVPPYPMARLQPSLTTSTPRNPFHFPTPNTRRTTW
jgi:hypothetical protein